MYTILQNARLIPQLTENTELTYADLVLEDSRILEIRPAGGTYENACVADLAGKTVIPGMFDLHMHLYFYTADFNALALTTADRNAVLLHAMEYAKVFLRQGCTTIRDCGNPFDAGVTVREAIERGIIEGPRIHTAGLCLSPTAMGNNTFPNLYAEVNTPEEILAECRKEMATGIDFIKYMSTGAVGNAKGNPGAVITSREELAAVQHAAESLGTYVGSHCHSKQGILLCTEAGIHTIEHASDIDAECTELILKLGGRTTIVPTLDPIALMQAGLLNEDASSKIRAAMVQEGVHPMLEASRAGVLTGWGTDVSKDFFDANPGCEFLLRSGRGYTNLELLQQATINSARILGVEQDFGTIAAGKIADLVVIDGNPDEDIQVMTKLPAAVFKGGRLAAGTLA